MSKIAQGLRKVHHSFCSCVVVAAGDSVRMGEDKLAMDLAGRSVLARTLCALNDCAAVDELIVVTKPEKLEQVAALRETYGLHKLMKTVIGGATRTESALRGVTEASRRAKIIAIHDAARPLVTPEIVADAVHQAVLGLAAAPAVPVRDTIRIVEDGTVRETPARESLFAMQTPQAFRAELIKAALTKAVETGAVYTDDCAAVEALGVPVRLSRGSAENLKITTIEDLDTARAILARRGGA
jgi:2-C-methyl-D-erythritol 4-phosphate cytidylyltransferase